MSLDEQINHQEYLTAYFALILKYLTENDCKDEYYTNKALDNFAVNNAILKTLKQVKQKCLED